MKIRKKLYRLEQTNKSLQRELSKQHKLKRKLTRKAKQKTCLCDRYWFPHRYQFGKCLPWDVWDRISLELGCKSKKEGGKCCF